MVDNKIISQVVSALLNQNGVNKTISKLYGTVEVNDGHKFVKLDGSDTLTAIVEGTEVMNGDRVLVSIENHQAVVLSNITSPASARTATSFMDFTEDGLVIGEIEGTDGNPPQSIVIGSLEDGQQGVYLRVGTTVIAKFIGDEYGYSKIEFGPFSAENDPNEYFGILDAIGLSIYKNFHRYNIYDAATRIQPGYMMIDDGNYTTEIALGRIYAENGCNAKVVNVGCSSAQNISVTGGGTATGSVPISIPLGYAPVGIVYFESINHPCYFIRTYINTTDKTVEYKIHNPGGSDWANVGVSFIVSCIWTG